MPDHNDWLKRQEAERLQDRADKLARQRERDAEFRENNRTRQRDAEQAARERDAERRRNNSNGGPGFSLGKIGWGVALLVLGTMFASGGFRSRTAAADNAMTEQTALDSNAASSITDEPVADVAPATEAEAEVAPPADDSSAPQAALSETIAIDEATDGEQQRAAIAAFRSGEPTRWKSGKIEGYAVPSEEVAGCRNITISIDSDQSASRVLRQCG